jgi:hypothetical protein
VLALDKEISAKKKASIDTDDLGIKRTRLGAEFRHICENSTGTRRAKPKWQSKIWAAAVRGRRRH